MKPSVLRLVALAGVASVLLVGYKLRSREWEVSINVAEIERPAQAARSTATAQNSFGLCLLRRELAQHSHENVLVSPLSLWQCGAMAQLGAGGAAKSGLRRALMIPAQAQDAQLNAANLALGSALKAQNGLTHNVANELSAGQKFPLVAGFTQQCQQSFGAEAANVDFADAATVQHINDWFLTKTGGKITDVVQEGDLGESTALCLTNAVYFHGKWDTTFDASSTRDHVFHCADGSQSQVPLMALDDLESNYLFGPAYEGVRLPYRNSTCALWALLPREGKTPASVLQNLDLAQLRDQRSATTISLQLPRFKMDFAAELTNDLKAMGAAPAFAANADFSPMLGRPGAITQLRHKALIEVDEEGTTAVAATTNIVAAAGNTTTSVNLIFDRPFVIALVEEKSGAAIMLGVVNAPQRF